MSAQSISLKTSDGHSLGAYEAGLVYYTVEAMRLNPIAATPKIVTGASAGSVNGFMTILQSCGAAVGDPTASLFWNAWIPLGLEKLHVKGQAGKTSAFSRAAFDARFLYEARKAGAKTIGGMGMLAHQGAVAFKMWTGRDVAFPYSR